MCCTDYPCFITAQVCAELDLYNFVICNQKESRHTVASPPYSIHLGDKNSKSKSLKSQKLSI